MKRIIVTVIAVISFAFANAQSTRFGVKGGINLSNFTGDHLEGTSYIVGFQAGGFASVKVADKFYIQPELLFSYQGSKKEESGLDYHAKIKANLSYLIIPVVAKYYITDKFNVEAGPQLGILLSAKEKYSGRDTGTEFSENENVKDEYKSIDLGFNLGAGYDFTENLSLGLRYTLGLSNVSDLDNNYSRKNSVFALSIGYTF